MHNLKAYGSYTYNYTSGLQRPTSIAVPDFDYANGIITPFTQQNASDWLDVPARADGFE